uniref:Peptidase A1 domain-containing protein n=1 Tax=Oryza meridionalis TaxID=40149 RepID=A0A0E0CCQ8_9ORYZ
MSVSGMPYASMSLHLLLAVSLCVALASSLPWAAASANGNGNGKPLVAAIAKDAATSLYTVPIKDGRPLVLDLAGALVWTSCAAAHPTLECHHHFCMHAHSYHPPGCPHNGYGRADVEDPFRCKCTAHPYNPFSGESAMADLTRTRLSANATDGKNPLYPVSFAAVTSCAPDSLLAKLPAGAVGVAGLARTRLALQAQVARSQKVANKFALCLPSGGGGDGVAIFGGGPLFLLPPGRPDVAATLAGETPLHRNKDLPGYFISATKIAVNQEQVQLYTQEPLVVELCTRIPYTALRPDVYRAVVDAFARATAGRKRVTPPAAAAAPFELCYDSRELGSTRLGYAVPQIDLVLEGGKNWTVFGGNSMAQVSDNTACLAVVKVKGEKGSPPPPAAIIGGFQMENNLVVQTASPGGHLLPRRVAVAHAGKRRRRRQAPRHGVTKDGATKLYTIAVKDGHPLALDLSGELVWSTCDASHSTVLPYERECVEANRYTPPSCWMQYGGAGGDYRYGNKCTAHPYNGLTGRCATGDLTRTALAADATNGSNPLYPVTFPAVASCAPGSLLASLPAGAVGVAGLGRSDLALHAQVAATQNVARKFALCLPSVAVFGGGPFVLIFPYSRPDITARLSYTALRRSPELGAGGYYITAKNIKVNQQQVPLPNHGPLVVQLSSMAPYTELRPDAWDVIVAWPKKVTPPVAPFELCYESQTISSNRLGYAVPSIDIELEDGATWNIFGGNSLVQVDDATACFAFVEMRPEKAGAGYGGGGAPAVVIGGHQMEHNLVVFDEEKQQLGFSGLLFGLQTTCTSDAFQAPRPRPILVRITKDTSTSLYTMSIKTGSRLVLDLGGPLLWSTCLAAHSTVPCRSDVCAAAAVQDNPWNCSSSTDGRGGDGGGGRGLCACSAYPYNPLSGQCARGDVTTTPMLANVTDGVNPLYPVAFPVHAACAPGALLGSLPSGAVGVAGLSGAPLSLPSQVAASLRVEKKFALCLPGGGTGAAIFGGGPFHLLVVPEEFGMVSNGLSYINYLRNPNNGGFYLDVVGIAVNHRGADVPPDSLALDAGTGRGGVMLSTVAPYTALRPDIYRAVIEAIDAELRLVARAPPSWPFDRCYQRSAMSWTRVGPPLATVDLMLRSGDNWTFFGTNMIVQVNEEALCFAIVEMGLTPAMDESPAVIIGGFQLEDNLLVFDLEKGRLGSTGLLYWIRTTCSNFNFSWGTPPS